MPSNEGHIHWNGFLDVTDVNYAEQDLELVKGSGDDPQGLVRIRAAEEQTGGLAIPTMGWETIPGTSPTLEARADAVDQVGHIRIRVA